MALDKYKTQILLLHSQQSTLDRLVNGFDDHYSVHVATSGMEALNVFNETPVHVIVSAQDLPGMSGLDALREAKKRSPETIGILLAGKDQSDGLEALVGEQEVFQIVRGEVTPASLVALIDTATKRARLLTLAESANDNQADVDQPEAEHIIMETSENGSSIISGGTGRMPILHPEKISVGPDSGSRLIEILVLTKDEEFLATVRDSTRGLHNVHHVVTPSQADEIVRTKKIGVLVTDAAMVGPNIDVLTNRLRMSVPRLVAVVAGRRDDGELLMDLINKGHVYRFLLKPVSPGRARLAIEASIKHHLDGPDTAFKAVAQNAAPPPAPPQPKAVPAPVQKAAPKPPAKPVPAPAAKAPAPKAPATQAATPPAPPPRPAPTPQNVAPAKPMNVSRGDSLLNAELDQAFGDDSSFTETVTGLAASVGRKFASVKENLKSGGKPAAPVAPVAPVAPTGEPARGKQPSPVAPQPVKAAPTPTPTPRSSVPATPATAASANRPRANVALFGAIAAGAVAIVIGGWVLFGGSEESGLENETAVGESPVFAESDIEIPDPRSRAANTAAATDAPGEFLVQARNARDEGRLIAPAMNNAVELYLAAIDNAPDNVSISTELDQVVESVVGLAESAIIEQRLDDAAHALQMIGLVNPDYPRLAFLTAQLNQLQYRSHVDNARVAVRDRRFEDAGALINQASAMPASNAGEIKTLSDELAKARSEQRVDEVLALATARLQQNNLITPANDNARYFFELVLSNDPGNTAARQGLTIVASKLVLQARTAIDDGQLNSAADLLRNARSLDANSPELAAANAALDDAVAAVARAEEKARADAELAAKREADRLAEERRAAAAELERQRLAAEATAATAAATQSQASSSPVAGPVSRQAAAGNAPAVANDTKPVPGNQSSANTGSGVAATTVAATNQKATAAGTTTSNTAPGNLNDDINARAARAVNDAVPNSDFLPISSLTRINYVAPKYPRSAQRRNITGTVDLTFRILANGTVTDIEVVESTPGNTFDEAAMDAVAEWRFEPTLENGIAVSRRTAVRLAFNLQ